MKKHVSVWMLLARSTIYKVVGLLLLLAAAEGILFYRACVAAEVSGRMNLEAVFDYSNILLVFAVVSLLMTVVLCRTNCEYGSRLGYTLRRLSVTENQVFLWQWLYASICYLLLWAVQIFVALALGWWYMETAEAELVSSQTLFLAFYRNRFLHSLMPLEEAAGWAGNLCLILGLGIAAAHFSYRQRRGKPGLEIISLYCGALAFFLHALGNWVNSFFAIGLSLMVIVVILMRVFGKEAEEDA